ncbi:MAG: helix-turn-helix transcriptional regulator [Atopobiaceae bacterium]|nr:helix-turn-helix transcriptional regulator [Kiritimatiellia bacterium]MBQ6650480.1 helix-turn-helix transcriptional regulator [Atopobiaceae bacterium]
MAHITTLEGLVAARLAETKTSKQQLADAIGVKSTATLNAKIAGTSELTLREGQALAEFCDVDVQDVCELVFGGEVR